MINREDLLRMFEEEQAILHGHFLLSSGAHSPIYLQCARVLAIPEKAQTLGRALAEAWRSYDIQTVISPAIGGIIIGHETARALGIRSIFTERVNGQMLLRRGFEIHPGEKVLAVEDVLTTGGSLREVIAGVKAMGGDVVAAGAIVLRGNETLGIGVPFSFLLEIEAPKYPPGECPLCREGKEPLVKPGSRGNY